MRGSTALLIRLHQAKLFQLTLYGMAADDSDLHLEIYGCRSMFDHKFQRRRAHNTTSMMYHLVT